MFRKILLSAGLSLLTVQMAYAAETGVDANPEAASQAEYDCMTFASGTVGRDEMRALYSQKHDKNALACAADYAYELARQNQNDIAFLLEATDVNTTYLDHLQLLMTEDLGGQQMPEWEIRLAHGVGQSEHLLAIMQQQWPDMLEVRAMGAILLVVLNQNENPVTAILTVRDSIKTLEQVTAEDPTVLGGFASTILGRIYFELPSFLGGDPIAAIKTLESAHQVNPGDLLTSRFLLEAYEAELEEDQAEGILKVMLEAQPDVVGHQSFADEYRYAYGIASRLGFADKAAEFKKRRDVVLAAHPELLTHQLATQSLHSGVNPITGE